MEVLVVEDSPTQAEHLRQMLQECGYAVRIAPDGESALAAARERKPTLILSDIVMPGIDGYELCRQVKADAILEDIPVILVTSLVGPHDILKGLECGADNFVTKPYDTGYLLSRVNHILARRLVSLREKVRFGAEIQLGGQTRFVTAEQQQILGLLLSSYEEAVRISQALKARERELEHSYQCLRALHRLAAGLNEATTEEMVLATALERAMDLPGVQAGWISMWSPESGFRLAVLRGLPPSASTSGEWSDCRCHRELLAGRLTEISNFEDCECLRKMSTSPAGACCHATIPVRGGSGVLGVMNLVGPQQGLFSERDLEILSGMGDQVAVAVQRAQLLQALERKVEERTAALQQEVAQRRRSETNYRTLFECANDPILIFEPENETILEANHKACATYGFSRDEFIGLSLKQLTKDPTRGEAQIGQLLKEGDYKDFETVHLRKDGTPLAMLCSSSVIEYERHQAVLSINRDITERKLLEEQLRQSQKLEAIGLLAGGVAHDFNNLLGVVLGYSELLLENLRPTDPNRKKAAQIKKATDSAIAITRQLLAFGRKQVLQPRLLDLNSLIADTVCMLRRLIGEDIELVLKPCPNLATVEADPGQIEQIIVNLAVNARDAMPRGGCVVIETANVELDDDAHHPLVPAGSYVMLAVSDNGIGMAPDVQARVFEPFFTTKDKSKGTGLGLATVYGIVRQSGGHVWFYSEPGMGTTFKIYLPQVKAGVLLTVPEGASEEPPHADLTVLLVEDADALREFSHELLEGWGYVVLEARNAAEAMQVAESCPTPLHLLITDVVMPGMSGPELAERLKSEHPEMKVLCVSGYAGEVLRDRYLMKDGTAFLQKPFSRQALAAKIRELLRAPMEAVAPAVAGRRASV